MQEIARTHGRPVNPNVWENLLMKVNERFQNENREVPKPKPKTAHVTRVGSIDPNQSESETLEYPLDSVPSESEMSTTTVRTNSTTYIPTQTRKLTTVSQSPSPPSRTQRMSIDDRIQNMLYTYSD